MEGIARYTFETTRRMVLDHPDDDFFFFFDRPYDDQFIFADNITPVVLGPQARHPLLWYIWFELRLPRAFKKYKIDVFYSADTYLSMKTSVPTLLVCHDLAYVHYPEHIRDIHLKYYRKNFPKFHRRANHVVAVSEFTRQDVIKNYGLSQDAVSVGYNATPPGFRKLTTTEIEEQKSKYTQGHPYFIYVGSLHPRKNLVRLIEAFDNFKSNTNNDHKLVLIGRFAWKNEELKDTYEKIIHKSDIILTGSIHEGIHPIVAASEGLFYVSLFEGFGIPILEGFSSHVPVVTSNVSSMPEVADDCGIVIDPTDTYQIEKAMTRLAKGSYPDSEIEKAANRAASFTWKKTANHIYAKLKSIT